MEPLAVLRFHVPLHLLQPFAAPSHPPPTSHSALPAQSTLPVQPALLPTPSTPSHTPADLSSHNNVVAWPGRRSRTSPVPEASRQLPATSAAAPPVPRVQYRPKGNSGNSPSNNASNSLGAVAAAALAAGKSTPLGLIPPLAPTPLSLAPGPLPVAPAPSFLAPAPFPLAPPPSPLTPVPLQYPNDLSGQPDKPLRLGAGECGRIMSTAKVRARSAVKRMTAAQPKEQQEKSGSIGGSSGSNGSSSSSSGGSNASNGSGSSGSRGRVGSSEHGSVASSSSCVLMQRAMEEFQAYMFPHQTNKLAFVFDPSGVWGKRGEGGEGVGEDERGSGKQQH